MAPFHYRNKAGWFSVDYRNNNGAVFLGEGEWDFETRWSGAGYSRIYCYSDAPNISGVAVAPLRRYLDEVTSDTIVRADFSSRVRNPGEGQTIIWRNIYENYAATRIKRIKHTDEGLPGTVLYAEYRILPYQKEGKVNHLYTSGDILRVSEQCKSALTVAVAYGESLDEQDRPIGVGHNRPPIECALNESQLSKTYHAIDRMIEHTENHTLDRDEVIETVRILGSVCSSISSWIARRLEDLSSNAAKVLGAGFGAWLVANVANWEAVLSRISGLISALSEFVQ